MKAVITAGGIASRFLPWSKASPKELLPVGNRPVIDYVVEEAVKSGINEILIILGREKYQIENYFDRSIGLERLLEEMGKGEYVKDIRRFEDTNILYKRQPYPMGLGDAILQAKSYIGDDPFFAVLLGDTITNQLHTRQLINVCFVLNYSVIGVEQVADKNVSKYGIVDINKLYNPALIYNIVEKPKLGNHPTNYGITGRYIFSNEIFTYLKEYDDYGELQLTHAMGDMIDHRKIYAYQCTGRRFDIGNVRDWHYANKVFLEEG